MDFQLKEIIDKYGNVFKNIVAETIRECNYKNVKVNSDVVSYAALLFYLNCKESFLDVGHMNFARGNVESFVRKTVSRIAGKNTTFNSYYKNDLDINYNLISLTRVGLSIYEIIRITNYLYEFSD